MRTLSESHKKSLRAAADRYHQSLPGSPGEKYLESRGLNFHSLVYDDKAVHRIGYVADPVPGNEKFLGFLAIPYIRRSHRGEWSVVSIRFRCIEDHDHKGHGKYMTQAGDRPRLYNTNALSKNSDVIAITEGELDALTAEACGLPAVGVPGVQVWQPYFRELFLGYREVLILADGDEAGSGFAKKVSESLPNARTIQFPPGEDVNSFMLKRGRGALKERIR